MLLELIFNVLLNNVPHGRTHNIASPWAPVGAKKKDLFRKVTSTYSLKSNTIGMKQVVSVSSTEAGWWISST